MAQPIVKVTDADRAAAAELCDRWIPTSRQEEVAEIIAKHVKDAALRTEKQFAEDRVKQLERAIAEGDLIPKEQVVQFGSDKVTTTTGKSARR